MVIAWAVVWPCLAGAGKFVLEFPIVHRAIEAYFEGTETVFDNMLWRGFEAAAGIKSPAEKAVALVEVATKVQEAYDAVKQGADLRAWAAAQNRPWMDVSTLPEG